MAKKSVPESENAGTKKNVKAKITKPDKVVASHLDTYEPDEIPTIILKSKTAVYLDTWFPVEAGQNKPARTYLDTWAPAVLFEKGLKKGMYLDTWIPQDGFNKQGKK